jgi:TRAP-type uncharacterized transport system fused permease subunit
MKKKKHGLEIFHHLLTGFVLTLKGVEKFEHHQLIGLIILASGILVLSYILYDVIKKGTGTTMKILMNAFEGIAWLFTTYVFFEEGKKYLPYVTLVASIGYFISVVMIVLRRGKSNE